MCDDNAHKFTYEHDGRVYTCSRLMPGNLQILFCGDKMTYGCTHMIMYLYDKDQ